jgi:hypothetical protein
VFPYKNEGTPSRLTGLRVRFEPDVRPAIEAPKSHFRSKFDNSSSENTELSGSGLFFVADLPRESRKWHI